MSKVKILQEFKTQIVDFFDALIIQFPTDSDLCMLRIFFNNQIDIVKVMNVFIAKLLPIKDVIKRRDVNFFLVLALHRSLKVLTRAKLITLKSCGSLIP